MEFSFFIAFYLVYFQIFEAEDLNNDLNARNYEDDASAPRGTIFDRNDSSQLAYSTEKDDGTGFEKLYL